LTRSNDDVADKRLSLLISLVVVSGAVAVGWAVLTAARTPSDHRPVVPVLLGVTAAIAIGSLTSWRIRILTHGRGISWPEVGMLVGLVVMPPAWVILCTCVAITIAKVLAHYTRQKAVFGVAKEVLVATAASVVFTVMDVQPEVTGLPLHAAALAIATLVMWLVDETLMAPVLALAMRYDIKQVLRDDFDLRVLGVAARYVATLLVVAILSLSGESRLLVLVAPLVLCVHLWQTAQARNRQELRAWQRLAETTDALNVVELGAVLTSAVTHASDLFSVEEAEIELHGDAGTRLIRGTVSEVIYDGDIERAPSRAGAVTTTELAGHDGTNPIGELRLRLHSSVTFTDQETYKFRTFASAVYTAIRNALAYEELERISAEHAYAAAHDYLTGLANRRELLEQAGRRFAEQPDDGMLALLLIDLNHFKEVNDTLGHATGDKVLRQVATRLQDASRPDDLVARLGGDEFAVLLNGVPTPAMATHRAETLLAALDHGMEVDGIQLTVEACGGIALAPGSGGVTELLRRADVAMYQAKRAGQRTATYKHSQDTADVGRLMLGGELKRAMAEHEFVVDFQPIVDLGTGEVISAEALTRWRHPDHGTLTAMQFLETVERSGQLPAFASAVLDQSLTAVRTWQEAGFDLPVAVNVLPRSLLDPAFPETVLARLDEHRIAPDRLVLELVETLTISQLEVVERTLRDLRDAGVQLALDDFGSGISPLSVLSQIPVHQLKIGREFVTAVETSSEAAAVIRSTVDLARSLHLTVVAEGVESEPQRHALWELGCIAGQGHLFARPMRAGRMLAMLQRGSGGRPGVLAGALHDAGSVVRMPRRRASGRGGPALPHLPA
jgi:diguanylate cyclase (GGDEF)-like protein